VHNTYAMKIIRLTIYDPTHIRLSKALLPAGMNLTRWINQAMCEKLDRDCPSTIGLIASSAEKLEPERQPIDPQAILAEMKKQDAEKNRPDFGPYVARYKDSHPSDYAIALANHKRNGKTGDSLGIEGELEKWMKQDSRLALSEEEKREIMAEHGRKQAEQVQAAAAVDPDAIPDHVKGHPLLYQEWRDKRDAELAGIKVPEVSPTGELSDTAEYLELCKPVKTAKPAEDEEDSFWGGYDKIKSAARK